MQKQLALETNIKPIAREDNNANVRSTPTYIDLFCGAGGLSLGFEQAGYKNLFSIDNDADSISTYRKNFPQHRVIKGDIEKLDSRTIFKLIGSKKVDVVIGGPPCQGFSIAGNIGRKFLDDSRNKLFKEFARIVGIVEPTYFVMENVARLYTHNKGATRQEIIKTFEGMGYKVRAEVLNSVEFGVPQVRKRTIIIGSKGRSTIKLPLKKAARHKTVKEALRGLPPLRAGSSSRIIPNHNAMNHSEQMLKKMSFVPDGGTKQDIPQKLRPKSGDVRKYMRYSSNSPSVCVTGDMRKVFHYSQNRALTVRELARLQTFPDNFVFEGKSISQQQQVGNAVPPQMSNYIAKSVSEMRSRDLKLIHPVIFDYQFPDINFIGNKEKMASWICDNLPTDITSIFDAFSGSGSVSYEAKKRGLRVISNDILKINYHLANALIENKNKKLTEHDVELIFEGKPIKGFAYNNFSNVYFYPDECMQLDLYRKNIEKLNSNYKKSLALSLLRRSMIRKMPYSRFNLNWDKIKQLRDEEYSYKKYGRRRAYHNKSFKYHFFQNLSKHNNSVFDNHRNNEVFNEDTFELIDSVEADLIYLDPPYTGTMNNYFSFYGAIDSYISSSHSEPFANNFVDRKKSISLFDALFSQLGNYKYWVLSYNNSSYPAKDVIYQLITKYRKKVDILEIDHKYKVTGKRNKNKNREYLFIAKST